MSIDFTSLASYAILLKTGSLDDVIREFFIGLAIMGYQQHARDVFNRTIISHALLGYEMVITNSALCHVLAIYHLISNTRSLNN